MYILIIIVLTYLYLRKLNVTSMNTFFCKYMNWHLQPKVFRMGKRGRFVGKCPRCGWIVTRYNGKWKAPTQ